MLFREFSFYHPFCKDDIKNRQIKKQRRFLSACAGLSPPSLSVCASENALHDVRHAGALRERTLHDVPDIFALSESRLHDVLDTFALSESRCMTCWILSHSPKAVT
ncbi:MAG TPA: hypothetical protein DEG28_09860 [Porphyromonadaceae bacterium]|nr:hypothetical protein [Porphyromonadaceae bacterium]